MRVLVVVALLIACKAKAPRRDDAAAAPVPRDAVSIDAGAAWAELAQQPRIDAVRVIALPAKANVPRFTLGGPVLLGDLAIVASSQFGFIGVDFRRGQLSWTKPAGSHVAPPLVSEGNAVLIGDCLNPPAGFPDDETLLGCMRIVTPTGSDQAFIAIRGKHVKAFDTSDGEQQTWKASNAVMWKRGDQVVAIDPLSGVAKPAPSVGAPLVVTYKDKTWEIRRTEDGIIDAKGKPAWRTERSYGTLIGAVYIPDQAPMVRAVSATRRGGKPEILMFDMDATGSLHGQVSMYPVPGIGIIGDAISKVGNTALAVRLDTSLERDYIAGYAANAALQWTYPLPQVPRPDRVGLAVAHDAVVVFHDGDTVTVLPELSAPPTAPGAVRDPSENATP